MRLVLDTNVILKALIKDSKVRAILLSPKHQLCLPEHAIEETREHLPTVERKTGLSREEIENALGALLAGVEVVETERSSDAWQEAMRIMGPIDVEDVPFLAAALSTACDGIWSDDKHLKRQTRVKVWTTKDMVFLG